MRRYKRGGLNQIEIQCNTLLRNVIMIEQFFLVANIFLLYDAIAIKPVTKTQKYHGDGQLRGYPTQWSNYLEAKPQNVMDSDTIAKILTIFI